MKKLFSILLVVAMLMSLFTTSALAITVESNVYTQDFTNSKSGTEAGQYQAAAAAGKADVVDGKLVIVPKSGNTTTVSMTGARVYLDNTNMVVGKSYKIYADVTFASESTKARTECNVNMKVIKASNDNSTMLTTSVKAGIPTTIASHAFTYDDDYATNKVNLRIDFGGYFSSESDRDSVTVDNVRVVEIVNQSMFKKARNVTFDDIQTNYTFDTYDYDKNAGGEPTIVASPGGKAGNSLKLTPGANDHRYTLKDFFDAEDEGKEYRISMKIYPTAVSSKGIQIGVKAFYANVTNNGWTGHKYYTVGEQGSGRDMIVNTWNTITFTATIGTHGGNVQNSIAFSQNGSSEVIKEFYVDDIVIEEVRPLFEKARNVTFENRDAGNVLKSEEYDKNGGGAPTIVASPGGKAGNSLKLTPDKHDIRYTLRDFFDSADKGKTFKITMKVYPTTVSSKGIRIGVKAFYTNVYNNGWTGDKYYTVGEAGSGRDMIVNTWNTITFTATIGEHGGNVQNSIAFAQNDSSEVIKEFYVDDIVIEEGQSIFKGARNVTFDDMQSDYTLDTLDYDKNGGDAPTIVASPSGSGNSLYIPQSNKDHRYTLKDFFDAEDEGKIFRITMKIYPTKADTGKGIKIGSKAFIPSEDGGWNGAKEYSVGEAGSTADMIAGTWNTISFTATIGIFKHPTTKVEYLHDSIAFRQQGATTAIPFYVDDIVIEELIVEESLIFDATTADAGYYAAAADADEKEGTIAFTSTILEKYLDLVESYGMYFFRTDIDEDDKNVELPSEDVASLKTAEGVFTAVVEEIPEGYFTTGVVAKPYVIIDGEVLYGTAKVYNVNEANKWLGQKAE